MATSMDEFTSLSLSVLVVVVVSAASSDILLCYNNTMLCACAEISGMFFLSRSLSTSYNFASFYQGLSNIAFVFTLVVSLKSGCLKSQKITHNKNP